MRDGIATGLDHAFWLLGYLIGLAPLYAAVSLFLFVAVRASVWTEHRLRAYRIRRDARRSGRLVTEGPGWDGTT